MEPTTPLAGARAVRFCGDFPQQLFVDAADRIVGDALERMPQIQVWAMGDAYDKPRGETIDAYTFIASIYPRQTTVQSRRASGDRLRQTTAA